MTPRELFIQANYLAASVLFILGLKSLTRADRAMDLILQKSLQSARASAFYSYLCGGLSAAGAVGAWSYLPLPFLVWFTAGCSLVFLASGIWYGRIARQQDSISETSL